MEIYGLICIVILAALLMCASAKYTIRSIKIETCKRCDRIHIEWEDPYFQKIKDFMPEKLPEVVEDIKNRKYHAIGYDYRWIDMPKQCAGYSKKWVGFRCEGANGYGIDGLFCENHAEQFTRKNNLRKYFNLTKKLKIESAK